jgi:hypothetical protein
MKEAKIHLMLRVISEKASQLNINYWTNNLKPYSNIIKKREAAQKELK